MVHIPIFSMFLPVLWLKNVILLFVNNMFIPWYSRKATIILFIY